MSIELVDKLVNAVLYEGYILYPYRPDSTKNRHRFTFGRVYPHAFSMAQRGAEPYSVQTQCLVEKTGQPILTVAARFLHPINRIVGELPAPLTEWSDDLEAGFRPVPQLRVKDRIYQTWQEAAEQKVTLPALAVGELVAHSRRFPFLSAASVSREPICDDEGLILGVIERRQFALEGAVEIAAEQIEDGLYKVTTRLENHTSLDIEAANNSEDEAVLMRTFISAHTILSVEDGTFISLLEPPDQYAQAVADCKNQGVFPVLVGDKEADQRDKLLSSPIIMYDYPEIAPESQGDLFDSTEIDEILTLRIMTMTDEEKSQMRQVDERARQILQRTENMLGDDLLLLHGTRRGLRSIGDNDE